MKPLINITVLLLMVIVFSNNVFGQPFRPYIYEKLNLTDKQITEVEKLRDTHLKRMSDYRNEITKLGIDIKSEWRSVNPDKKKIESFMNKIGDIRSKMNQERVNHWFDILNLLDEKQKEKFRELRADFFGDKKFWGRKYKKDFYPRKPGFGRGLGPCGMGFGPWVE